MSTAAMDARLAGLQPPGPKALLAGLRATLASQGLDYGAIVRDFGQVAASEARESGREFTLRDHVRGLILSQLSNQRPWGPIAARMGDISRIFLDFDPSTLEAARPEDLIAALRDIRCGNRSLGRQMASLPANIRTFRLIERRHRSVDVFVTSSDPDRVARQLSDPGEFKLRQLGYTLALEYLRNVGIRAAKPDVHVRRVISNERLGYTEGYPSEAEAYRVVAELSQAAGCNPTYLDNLLWLFCAQDYGNVCGARPRCGVCALRDACRRGVRPRDRPTPTPVR